VKAAGSVAHARSLSSKDRALRCPCHRFACVPQPGSRFRDPPFHEVTKINLLFAFYPWFRSCSSVLPVSAHTRAQKYKPQRRLLFSYFSGFHRFCFYVVSFFLSAWWGFLPRKLLLVADYPKACIRCVTLGLTLIAPHKSCTSGVRSPPTLCALLSKTYP